MAGSRSEGVSFPETKILDQLTYNPRSFLLNVKDPTYKSTTAKKMNNTFAWKSKANPMLLTPEAGLVLYERVVTHDQESALLDKLSKPKHVRGRAPPNQPTKPQAAIDRRLQQELAGVREEGGAGFGSEHAGHATTSSSHEHDESNSNSYTPSHRKYSTGQKYGINVKKTTPEEEEMRDYYKRERQTMTAHQVFTWGGRFKYSGPTQGASRQTMACNLHKPPLRL